MCSICITTRIFSRRQVFDPGEPPTTLDELREAAIACTDPSKNQYGLGLPTDYGYYCEYLWGERRRCHQ